MTAADLEAARDAGRATFQAEPDAILAVIARMGAKLYANKDAQLAFLEGYQQARAQHDDFIREQKETDR